MTIYHLDHICKRYEKRTVLDVSNLIIEQSHVYALLGPNGAGKTTLLNILAFLEPPTEGRMLFDSQPVRFVEKELQKLRRRVIMVDQHPILFTGTVFSNLEFGLKIRNIPRRERARIIEETLDLVGMREFIKAPAHRLSGGETQRVALARALALSPQVFLCDEPTSSVDVENQAIIINILRQINTTKQITILFTTHDRAQAAEIAHHTLVLDHGRLVRAGYENIFSAIVEKNPGGESFYTLQNDMHLFSNAQATHPLHRRIKIFVDPLCIELDENNQGISEKNVFTGRVRQVMEENAKIRMVVDSGVRFTLLLSEKAYRQSRILVGDRISYRIPQDAVHVISKGSSPDQL